MSQLIYTGGYTLSQLRAWTTCGSTASIAASTLRSKFYGYGSTGNMALATNSWIDTACWQLSVYSGSGYVGIVGPWSTGYSTTWYSPQSYALTSNHDSWVTLNAYGDTNYYFSYWMRMDPWEIWSYSAYVSYYIPTSGWDSTYYIGASFYYSPPSYPCYTWQIYGTYYAGSDCSGNYFSGYGYGDQICATRLDYGGYRVGDCLDPNCVLKGTLIELPDGSQKLVEDIRVGDILKGMKISDAPEDDTITGWSTDSLNLVETEVRVTGIVPVAVTKTYIFNNGLLETTGEHGHFIKRENNWKFEKAQDVQIGDFLVQKDGTSIEIVSIDIDEYIPEPVGGDPGKPRKSRKIVYDINVETTDTFIANGLITHNRPIREAV